jgi:hypothetical protein
LLSFGTAVLGYRGSIEASRLVWKSTSTRHADQLRVPQPVVDSSALSRTDVDQPSFSKFHGELERRYADVVAGIDVTEEFAPTAKSSYAKNEGELMPRMRGNVTVTIVPLSISSFDQNLPTIELGKPLGDRQA